MVSCLHIPEPNCLTKTAGGKHSSIGRPSRAHDTAAMSMKGSQKLPSLHIPEPDCVIERARGKHASIRRPTYLVHLFFVPLKRSQVVSRFSIRVSNSFIIQAHR